MGLELRSPNFKSVQVTLTGTVTAGLMAKRQELVGVYAEAGVSGDVVEFIYQCDKIVVPKAAATGYTFTQGDKVYFDAAEAGVNNSSSGNTLCGRALETVTETDTEVEIELNGALAA